MKSVFSQGKIKTRVYLGAMALFFSANVVGQPLQWANQLGGNSEDQGKSVTMDAQGNVFAVGDFEGVCDFDPTSSVLNFSAAGSKDFFISKSDANGGFLWSKAIGGTGADFATGVACDAAGNVYISGYFENTVDFDPGTGVFNLVSNGGTDAFILKLDDAGNFVWAKQIGGIYEDKAKGIAIDTADNILVTGFMTDTVDIDPGAALNNFYASANNPFVLKLDAAGSFVWAKQFSSSSNAKANSITVDVAGNVYTVGYYQYDTDFDPGVGSFTLLPSSTAPDNGFVSKLDAAGNFVWAKHIRGDDYIDCYDVHVDAADNVFVAGWFQGSFNFNQDASTDSLHSAGIRDAFLLKLNSSGNYLWAKRFGTSSYDEANAIATDAAGNAYLIGYFEGAYDFDPGAAVFNMASAGGADLFVVVLDSLGDFVKALRLGGPQQEVGFDILLNANDEILLTGYFNQTVNLNPGSAVQNFISAGASDAFVLKLGSIASSTHKIEMTDIAGLNIFPNPTKGNLTIELEQYYDEVQVTVLNALGQMIQQENYRQTNMIQLDIIGNSGLYMLEIKIDQNKYASVKIFKQ